MDTEITQLWFTCNSYLPEDEHEALRTIVRFRRTLTQDSTRCINRIQKSLELMNIKFHTVISDIVGQSGQAVLKAIIAGELEAVNFLPCISYRIKADRDVVIKSLEGNWRDEHLYTLQECYSMYLYYRERIQSCPNNKISGGKQISSYVMKKKPNAASLAFKHAANAVQKSDHWLGDYFRRMKAKGGNKYAITATAAKIARIYYRMITQKEEFRLVELSEYQEKFKLKKIAYLERKLASLKQEAT